MRTCSLLLTASLLACVLGGCLGPVSLDEYKYVSSIGVDVGQAETYSFTFLVQSEASDSSTQSAAGKAIMVGAEGEDLFHAITTVHMGVPYQLNFERLNTIVFAKETAEQGALSRMSRVSLNALNIRQSVKLMVSLCTAREFLEGMAGAGMQNMTKLQYSLFRNYNEEGTSPLINYSLVHEAVRGGRLDPVITLGGLDESAVEKVKEQESSLTSESNPQSSGQQGGQEQKQQEGQNKEEKKAETTTEGIPRLGGMAVYAAGSALFDGWNMVGVLDSYDTRFLLMGAGEFIRGSISIPYEDSRLTVLLADTGAYMVDMQVGETPRGEVSLLLTCEVLQDDQQVSKQGWENGLRQEAEAYIEAELERVFLLCQSLNCDAMGMGRAASRNFVYATDWEAYDWKSKYPQLELTFHVRLVPLDDNINAGLE